jgi:Zn-dependent M28 family amino/carboxypeptidase
MALARDGANMTLRGPVLGLDRAGALALGRPRGRDSAALVAANESVPLEGTTVTITARRTSTQAQPPNVVGIIEGSDPNLRDTYVVISAHIDHVGVGSPDATGDSIYNGADDDASGTSAMIEVAQAFAALPVKPARSIIFLGVSGEEKGLFGSRWFTDNPPVDASKLVANINVDMIGRNAPDSIVAIGLDYSSLGPLTQQVARSRSELGLTVAPDLWPEEQLFVRSDHFNFARIGVPSAYFKGGIDFRDRPEDRRRMKASYTAVHYHQPTDEIAQWWNLHGAVEDMRLVLECLLRVASADKAPTWTPGDEFEKLR